MSTPTSGVQAGDTPADEAGGVLRNTAPRMGDDRGEQMCELGAAEIYEIAERVAFGRRPLHRQAWATLRGQRPYGWHVRYMGPPLPPAA